MNGASCTVPLAERVLVHAFKSLTQADIFEKMLHCTCKLSCKRYKPEDYCWAPGDAITLRCAEAFRFLLGCEASLGLSPQHGTIARALVLPVLSHNQTLVAPRVKLIFRSHAPLSEFDCLC